MRFTAPYSVVAAGNLALHLHPDHLADLRDSGLTDESIKAAGVYSLRPCDLTLFFNSHCGVPEEIESALCFPYEGGDFARIKLFPSLGKMKYAQPPKTNAHLYMPIPVDARPVIVTEGEKKTLAAFQAGLNAIGIGGVWNWLGSGAPIGDLNLVTWDGRDVTIVPDSDVFSRTDLLRATYALGRELQSRGAKVCVAQIVQTRSTKVGLDDFLVAGGRIEALEVFSLGHRVFKSCGYWHGKWKMKAALAA